MVDIIPKEQIKTGKGLNFLFYLSIFLLLFSVISWFFLNSFLKKTKEDIAIVESALIEKMSPEESSLENEVLSAKKKIDDFSFLINNHLNSSRFFGIIQNNCHPKAWFSVFSLVAGEKTLKISGKTENFETLGQQISILNESVDINNVNLNDFSIGEDGKISFSLSLIFN